MPVHWVYHRRFLSPPMGSKYYFAERRAVDTQSPRNELNRTGSHSCVSFSSISHSSHFRQTTQKKKPHRRQYRHTNKQCLWLHSTVPLTADTCCDDMCFVVYRRPTNCVARRAYGPADKFDHIFVLIRFPLLLSLLYWPLSILLVCPSLSMAIV